MASFGKVGGDRGASGSGSYQNIIICVHSVVSTGSGGFSIPRVISARGRECRSETESSSYDISAQFYRHREK